MTSDNDNSGNGHDEGEDGDFETMVIAQQQELLFMRVCGILQVFAPHLQPDAVQQLATSVVGEQFGPVANEILPSMYKPDVVANLPTILMRLGRDKEDIKIDVKAAKRFERLSDPGAAAHAALLLAVILSPEARAVLRAFGWKYQFMQSAEPVGGGIILPH